MENIDFNKASFKDFENVPGLATHTFEQLDKVLDAFEYADQKLNISKLTDLKPVV